MRTGDEDNRRFDAVIVDLDGVVTDTAALHRVAWKETFDALLNAIDPKQRPFDDDRDYLRYVDGKPRHDGVRSFLESRQIELPEGADDDALDDHTARGVGNTKNARFHELLDERGATVFDNAVQQLRTWKQRGLAIAVVSSSRNCRAILKSAGLDDISDAHVDGNTLEELSLKGKPAPDMFEEAARRLGIDPQRAIVIEDALAGVEAAQRGGFGCVVAIDRSGERHDAFRERGADVVVGSLVDVSLESLQAHHRAPAPLPDRLEELERRLKESTPAVFLDYDGTLTPIVDRPERAVLSDSMRDAVRRLAGVCTVAIISGRDRLDVEQRVQLENVFYAGSHGFDIRGPAGRNIEYEVGSELTPLLDDVVHMLDEALETVDGAQIERKKYSVAVHFRNVQPDDVERVEDAVAQAVSRHEELRRHRGKKVFEIQPDIDWNKGQAVLWLLTTLELDGHDTVPIYIGDDTTDEDAFEALRGRGIGIVVEPGDRASSAHYQLESVDAVKRFIDWMAHTLTARGQSSGDGRAAQGAIHDARTA